MCPRGEIGRHKGLKILALLGVPVRVWPRAPVKKMNKILIISDKNDKSLKIKKIIFKLLNKKKIERSNVTIVIGGDGFMLQTLKKNKNSKKSFYGVNSGNYGFLMNKFSKKLILKNLSKAKIVNISPLEMSVKTKKTIKKNIAINEVSIIRSAVAFNINGIIVKERSFPSKSKLLYKSASGGVEHIKIFQVANVNTTLKFLKTKEFWISAFDISAKKDFTKHEWKGKNVLLFGSEGFGIKAKTLENSDFIFRVNMNNNVESLNISNTVSVVCHHVFQSTK